MTLFVVSAIFSFTALNQGGVLWKQQGRDENGKEGGSRRNPRTKNLIKFLLNSNSRAVQTALKFLGLRALDTIAESLILAQNERWRRVLSMQVERDWGACSP